jgi:hypothetical protein
VRLEEEMWFCISLLRLPEQLKWLDSVIRRAHSDEEIYETFYIGDLELVGKYRKSYKSVVIGTWNSDLTIVQRLCPRKENLFTAKFNIWHQRRNTRDRTGGNEGHEGVQRRWRNGGRRK